MIKPITTDRRFRCCSRTQDGNFCTECGSPKKDQVISSLNELIAYLESKRDGARSTKRTLEIKFSESDAAIRGGVLVQKLRGWQMRELMFMRFLAVVESLTAEKKT